MESERLQKYLAAAGIASRRACETLITSGLVKVNGEVVRELGTKVTPGVDIVEYDGHQVNVDRRHAYLLLHKPPRCITSVYDPEGRETVMEFIPKDFGRVFPVGRLDWDSEGAVLMTTDGTLTQLLTHPKHEVPKTYEVKVRGVIDPTDPRLDLLRRGVRLDDGFKTAPATVTHDASTGRNTWLVVSIHEGRNRQLRRMFDAVGIGVQRLKRVAYGPVILADLPPTQFRRLREEEVEELYIAAGGKRARQSASRGRLADGKREGIAAMRRSAARLTAPRRIEGDTPLDGYQEDQPYLTRPHYNRDDWPEGPDRHQQTNRSAPRGDGPSRSGGYSRDGGATHGRSRGGAQSRGGGPSRGGYSRDGGPRSSGPSRGPSRGGAQSRGGGPSRGGHGSGGPSRGSDQPRRGGPSRGGSGPSRGGAQSRRGGPARGSGGPSSGGAGRGGTGRGGGGSRGGRR